MKERGQELIDLCRKYYVSRIAKEHVVVPIKSDLITHQFDGLRRATRTSKNVIGKFNNPVPWPAEWAMDSARFPTQHVQGLESLEMIFGLLVQPVPMLSPQWTDHIQFTAKENFDKNNNRIVDHFMNGDLALKAKSQIMERTGEQDAICLPIILYADKSNPGWHQGVALYNTKATLGNFSPYLQRKEICKASLGYPPTSFMGVNEKLLAHHLTMNVYNGVSVSTFFLLLLYIFNE